MGHPSGKGREFKMRRKASFLLAGYDDIKTKPVKHGRSKWGQRTPAGKGVGVIEAIFP
jgi:hypothetical protein